jgi:tRNA(fMet)-specific endonuclease VapC
MARNSMGKAFSQIAARPEMLIVTSIIVCCEIEYGLELKKSDKLRQRMLGILGQINVLSFDPPAQEKYGMLRAELKRIGKPIGPNDLFIAAHALALDAVLVTDNEKEFSRVPGLKIENWLR